MKFRVGDYITLKPKFSNIAKEMPQGIFMVTELNGDGVFISKIGRDWELFRSDIFRKCTEKEIRLNKLLNV